MSPVGVGALPPDRIRLSAALSLLTPVMVVAPMVGQCDLPFRELCRANGADLVYSEMLIAERFATEPRYRVDALGSSVDESGPLIVQFAATTPESFLKASIEAHRMGAAGADLNLGCPQLRAKEGGYGAYLADNQSLCVAIIEAAARHFEDDFCITVKIRLQKTHEETVSFATRLAKAGARIVTLHARHRGRTDARRDGAAELDCLPKVCDALYPLGVAVFSNGNVRCAEDVVANLKTTGACGIMSAEEILRNPGLFGEAKDLILNKTVRRRRQAELVEEYLNWTVRCERNCFLKRVDGSVWGKNGALTRAASNGGGARYSVWWANVECIRQHVKIMLLGDAHREMLQRNTFRRTDDLHALDTYIRRRFRLTTFDGDDLPPADAKTARKQPYILDAEDLHFPDDGG